jgi:hypothetical protein
LACIELLSKIGRLDQVTRVNLGRGLSHRRQCEKKNKSKDSLFHRQTQSSMQVRFGATPSEMSTGAVILLGGSSAPDNSSAQWIAANCFIYWSLR